MATSVGSHFSSFRGTEDAPCSLERVVRLASCALDVPVAWIVMGDAIAITPSGAHASSDVAWSADTLCALHDVASPIDRPRSLEEPGGPVAPLLEKAALHAVAAAPIQDEAGADLGALYVADRRPRAFNAHEMEHLETLALLAAPCSTAQDVFEPAHHLHRVVQQTNHGVVVTDPGGRVTWVNEGFVQLCGYTPDELRGKKPGTVLQGPKTDESVVAAIRHHVQRGEGFTAELVNYRKSGEPYWVHIQAEPIFVQGGDTIAGFVALETDVSERKALQETLRLERDLLATTIDTMEALVVVIDAEGRIVRFNEACRRVTGYDSTEVIGEHVAEVLIPEDERSTIEAAMRAHRSGQQQSSFECHWLSKSGERRLIEWSNTMITDNHGSMQYLLGTGIDITERRQLEQQILAVSEEERRRIGQDLHDILASHLAGTAMMAKSLRQQLSRGRDVTEDDLEVIVEQIQKASQQARALSHSLMPARFEGHSLGEALHQLARNKQELMGFPHTVEVGADLPELGETAAMHLYRIAYEAINNAAKHAAPSHVWVRLYHADDRVVLEVRDDGVGIPPGVDPVDGLGLHMMHHRADVIGATLHVTPAEGEGTVVRCNVPLDAATAS